MTLFMFQNPTTSTSPCNPIQEIWSILQSDKQLKITPFKTQFGKDTRFYSPFEFVRKSFPRSVGSELPRCTSQNNIPSSPHISTLLHLTTLVQPQLEAVFQTNIEALTHASIQNFPSATPTKVQNWPSILQIQNTQKRKQSKTNNETEIEACLQWSGLQSSYPSAQTAKSESELSVEKSTQTTSPTIEKLQINTNHEIGWGENSISLTLWRNRKIRFCFEPKNKQIENKLEREKRNGEDNEEKEMFVCLNVRWVGS